MVYYGFQFCVLWVYVCVSHVFTFFCLFYSHLFVCLFACLVFKEREKESRELCGWGGGEDPGGDEGGKGDWDILHGKMIFNKNFN